MNIFHYAVLAVLAIYVVLRVRNRGRARKFARGAVIGVGALLVLSPFA